MDGKSGTAITDTYDYDIHDRLKTTATSGSSSRTLTHNYNNLGNITSSTSTNSGDSQATAYQYGEAATGAGPHAVSGATINGIYTKIYYDANGAITSYVPTWSAPKKFIAYNSINQPTTITVGTSLTDTNPVAKDEFRYSPEGERYYKKSTYQQSGSLRTEHTFYVGSYEVIIFDAGATYQSEKSLIGNLLHVRKTPFAGAPVEFQYVLHRDHLGSTDAITLDNGNLFTSLAFEPFGARRNPTTLTGNTSTPQLNDLYLKMDALPSAGYTGHEALDRTGFIHMNGRVYDPQLARFVSPDPLVQAPTYSQSWNRYSYVFNNPLKYVDPTGYATETVCVTQHYEQESVTTCTVTTTPDAMPSSTRQTQDPNSEIPCGAACPFVPTPPSETNFGDMLVDGFNALPPQWGPGEVKLAAATFKAAIVFASKVSPTIAGKLANGTKGIVAKDGTKITGFTKHGVDRVIGDGGKRAGTNPSAIRDALKNPLKIKEGLDSKERPFKIYQGQDARVVVNPDTGKIVSTNPLSRAGTH